MKKVHYGVGEFAKPVVRQGSIAREGLQIGKTIGIALHQALKAEKLAAGGYQSEVALKWTFPGKRYAFAISGKADGVFSGPAGKVIEEIKTSFYLDNLVEKLKLTYEHPYRLQALTYAHILEHTHGSPPQTHLLLVSANTQRKTIYPLELDQRYFDWLAKRLLQLEHFHRLILRQKKRRRGVSRTVSFPFSAPRRHQDELMALVEQTTLEGGKAMIQAPTGIGKTIGVLLPILKQSLSMGNQTVYLTPKNRQFQVVKETIGLLAPKARAIKTYILTAKKKLCLQDQVDCHPDYCKYARNYYDKFADADLGNRLLQQAIVDGETLTNVGKAFQVCPYQLQMDTLNNADLIVGDYNYVFSPRAGLSEVFRQKKKKEKLSLIIDEAHNLYARSAEYFSPSIELNFLENLKEFLPSKDLHEEYQGLIAEKIYLFLSHRPRHQRSSQISLDKEGFFSSQTNLQSLAIAYFISCEHIDENDPILLLFLRWTRFTEVLRLAAEESVFSYEINGQSESIKITCCDTSEHLAEIYSSFHTVIAFSATIKPFPFYQSLSGLSDSTLTEFPTAFADKNRKVIIIPQVSTTWKDRLKYIPLIVAIVEKISQIKPGNYIVFFPSYDFLEKVESHFATNSFQVVSQKRNSSAYQLEHLEKLLTNGNLPTIVLAVQGGALSEGIDLNSPYLLGAFIVGPAIPMMSFERELLKNFYQEKFGQGFAYAYIYPAMARSIQAAGRVIRSAKKKGLIVLIGHRFQQTEYCSSMPSFWYKESVNELVPQKILSDIGVFWDEDPV